MRIEGEDIRKSRLFDPGDVVDEDTAAQSTASENGRPPS
jgi:hypothetical protein